MNKKVMEDLEKHIEQVLTAPSGAVRAKIFKEVLTRTERTMLAKRLAIIYLIGEGVPTHTVAKQLRMSPSTVARFELRVEKNTFPHSAAWLKKARRGVILNLLTALASIPFKAQNKSLAQLSKDW